MKRRSIYITDFDMERLRNLLEGMIGRSKKDREYLESLSEELDDAVVVPSNQIPPDVVTMNSNLRVTDLDTGKEMVLRLVFPSEADFDRGKVSVLAPIGTALIGYRVGDTVEWEVPSGLRRLHIEEVIYQPEAAGDFHL